MTERISALYVSQEDVRRGNVDIKPLEFVPVSDGRKLRKEKRPLPSSPPSAPIDFVRRLFRSWAWISEFRIRCCSSEGAEEGEIFDHNSSTKGRKNSFLLFFSFPIHRYRKRSLGGKHGGNNSIRSYVRFLSFPAFFPESWASISSKKRDNFRVFFKYLSIFSCCSTIGIGND